MVKKFLILVPASLGFQWTNEMVEKFNLEDIFYNRKGRGWNYFDYQIASLDKAKRKKHTAYLNKIDFDMVIVDEAHRLKNRDTKNWQFVKNLQKKYCLLLTATPLQNDIRDLFNLISITHPDFYHDFNQFKEKYKIEDYTVGKPKKLKQDLEQVMIRNCHRNTIMQKSDRHVKHISIELEDREREVYNKITEYVKNKIQQESSKQKNVLSLLNYQRELCSSFVALKKTLEKKDVPGNLLKEVKQLITEIKVTSKLRETKKILASTDSQVLIFTKYRATQNYIAYWLEECGFNTILFHGGHSMSGKEYVKYIFQQEREVMICTEAGSQGLNLQFCNWVINYDLPWNPMKLEQRIGRVHRLGQNKDVFVYNLVYKDSVEEKILHILLQKIKLLRAVMKDFDNILLGLEEKKFFEEEIQEIFKSEHEEVNVQSLLL